MGGHDDYLRKKDYLIKCLHAKIRIARLGRLTKFLDLKDDRELSIAQIKALSILFKIDPSVFI